MHISGDSSVMTKVMTKQGFPDCVYAQAADTFRASCVEKTLDYPGVLRYAPVPHPGNEHNTKQHQIWAYELAFNTLKCKSHHYQLDLLSSKLVN